MTKFIKISKLNGVFNICLNRPEKLNAFAPEMYHGVRDALREAAKCSETFVTVLSSTGRYYSSGNDMGYFLGSGAQEMDVDTYVKEARQRVQSFVAAFIDHPKPLIALVQGPAVGIACTTLGLCDIVIASDAANEVLLFGRKLTSSEALTYRLVTDVIPLMSFETEAWRRVHQYVDTVKRAPKAVARGKRVLRAELNQQLHTANRKEFDALVECWKNSEQIDAVMRFFEEKQQKPKL